MSLDLVLRPQAKIDLATGAKVVQVSIGGKFIRYQDTQKDQLDALLNTIAIDLGLVQPRAYAKNKSRFF